MGERMETELINKYSDILPAEFIDIWREYGYASMLDGYLRVINPEEYQDIVNNTYIFGNEAIPIMVTAFGDIITCEKDGYIGIVNYKDRNFHIIARRFKSFLRNYKDEYFIKEYFEYPQFEKARELLGTLKNNECYGYVPLLCLGGSKNVSNLKITDTKIYIELITQAVGIIGK